MTLDPARYRRSREWKSGQRKSDSGRQEAWILSDVLMFLSNVFGKETRIVSVELGKYNDEFLLN